jgi:hypothetical protein
MTPLFHSAVKKLTALWETRSAAGFFYGVVNEALPVTGIPHIHWLSMA